VFQDGPIGTLAYLESSRGHGFRHWEMPVATPALAFAMQWTDAQEVNPPPLGFTEGPPRPEGRKDPAGKPKGGDSSGHHSRHAANTRFKVNVTTQMGWEPEAPVPCHDLISSVTPATINTPGPQTPSVCRETYNLHKREL